MTVSKGSNHIPYYETLFLTHIFKDLCKKRQFHENLRKCFSEISVDIKDIIIPICQFFNKK